MLVELPYSIRVFQTTQPFITIVTAIGSSCVGSFPTKSASMNVIGGLHLQRCHFLVEFVQTPPAKPLVIDHTSNNTKGIFLLSLLAFSLKLLIIVAPTSNVSTSEFASAATFDSSFITTTITKWFKHPL